MRVHIQVLFLIVFATTVTGYGQLLGKGKGILGTLGDLTKPLGNVTKSLGGVTQTLGGVTKPLGDVLAKTTNLLTEQFGDFKKTYKKTYKNPEEEKKKLEIFSLNLNNILDLNKVLDLTFKLKINELADLALEDFNKLLNGLRVDRSKSHGLKPPPKKEEPEKQTEKPPEKPPEKPTEIKDIVDWRTKGAVTLSRSQGLCGSCYAFAAAGALEAQYFLKTKKLQYLSPQNLMDCTQGVPYDNNGCISGAVDPSYDFVKANGINPENAYPYEEKLGPSCRFVKEKSAGNVTGYILLDEGDEKGLEEAVRNIGPVAVGIDAHAKTFQFYSEGVYYEPTCGSSIDDLNHAVLIIGFGTEPNGEKYWLFKNSYGPTWGMNGFGKITRNVTNHCGIATYAVYPLI